MPSFSTRLLHVLMLLFSSACAGSADTDPSSAGASNAGPPALVVGLESDDMGVFLDRLHIQTTVDGKPTTDEWLTNLEHGDSFGPPPWWPKEIHLVPPRNNPTAEVFVSLEGFFNPNQYPESNFPGVDLWPGLSPNDPIESFLGKPLDVSVDVEDARGLGASALAHVMVDTQVVCPQGPCP